MARFERRRRVAGSSDRTVAAGTGGRARSVVHERRLRRDRAGRSPGRPIATDLTRADRGWADLAVPREADRSRPSSALEEPTEVVSGGTIALVQERRVDVQRRRRLSVAEATGDGADV